MLEQNIIFVLVGSAKVWSVKELISFEWWFTIFQRVHLGHNGINNSFSRTTFI